MSRHRTPEGQNSSYDQPNGSPAVDPTHTPRHAANERPAGSDLPARGTNVIDIDTRR